MTSLETSSSATFQSMETGEVGPVTSHVTSHVTPPVHATTSGPPSQATTTSTSSGVPTGALAGAAVGCLLGGLAIGVAVAFFLLRRRRKRYPSRPLPARVAVTAEHKGSEAPEVSLIGNGIQLGQFLLDSTSDKDIAEELQSLGQLIHLHVENNYHSRPVQVSSSTLARSLQTLGVVPQSGSDLQVTAGLVIDPMTRQIGLEHVISHLVFKSVDFHSRSSLSMLPAPVNAFLHSIPFDERHENNTKAISFALSRWRSLSAFLMHPHRDQRTPLTPTDPAAATQSVDLVNALNTFLHHFVSQDQSSQHQQANHLQAVVLECTKFGYLILSQPSDWDFSYETESTNSRMKMVVLCPGLDKRGDKDGREYNSSRRVVAPLVAQV